MSKNAAQNVATLAVLRLLLQATWSANRKKTAPTRTYIPHTEPRWQNTRHANAEAIDERRLALSTRHYVERCLLCHVAVAGNVKHVLW